MTSATMAQRRSAATAIRLGSIGAIVPLLIVAEASAVAERREALNAPDNSKTSASDCVTNTAMLVFRGLGTGVAWTIAVDSYALASVTDAEVVRHMANRPGFTVAGEVARKLGPLCVRNMLGFAGFLGLYGSVSCSLEKMRGKNDLFNSFVGGFTAGLAFVWHERPKPRKQLTSAFAYGMLAMALHHFIPAITDASGNEDTSTTEAR